MNQQSSNDPADHASAPAPPDLIVHWTNSDGAAKSARFSRGFSIGRQHQCDLHLDADCVSRRHAEVFRNGRDWWVRDTGSANGTFLNGRRIETAALGRRCRLRIGLDGPVLDVREDPADAGIQEPTAIPAGEDTVILATRPGGRPRPPATTTGATPVPPQSHTAAEPRRIGVSRTGRPQSQAEIAARYFRAPSGDGASEHTQAFRLAFNAERQKLKRRYRALLAGVVALALAAFAGSGIFLLWQQQKVEQARLLAVDLFYDMKALELDLSRLRSRVRGTEDAILSAELKANQAKLEAMSARYEQYLQQDAPLARPLNQKELTILRMARVFGECELNMPDSFRDEVLTYIDRWKSTGRLTRAINFAKHKGYVEIVRDALVANELPTQFFYLALQESNFNDRAVGPPTRHGIAKGAWQFIPDTASRYGLRIGALAEEPVYDPDDDRFDFVASTRAAAEYLRDIYETDAQASGLLVMASYNWGEGNIVKRIRGMPENPRERNFWRFVERHEIPQETYDYVLSIFAAAVIGEKPSLFGFDFDKPI